MDYVLQCLISQSSGHVKNYVTLQKPVYDSLGLYLRMFQRWLLATMTQALFRQSTASLITQIKIATQFDITSGRRC